MELQALLALIPEGGQYQLIKDALIRVAQTFPEQMPEITTARVQGWVNEVTQGGGRDAQQIRNDIFQYIVEPGVIQQKMGINAQQADDLINQRNNTQFALTPGVAQAGDVNANEGAVLTILHGRDQQWTFDPTTNKWYVSYGIPNSDRELLFEAEADQMDALFGVGGRPSNYQTANFRDLVKRQNVTFSGNVAEMEGEGWFEDEFEKVTALALDEGKLPSWMNNDPKALEALFVAQAEGKDDDWLLRQWSSLPSFQARFPGIDKIKQDGNMNLDEAVQGFLEYEAGLRQIALQYGKNAEEITPQVVSGLMTKGYTLKYTADVFTAHKRKQEFAPAMDAFNQILAAKGLDPLSASDQIAFMMGQAPQEVYDTYEASSYQEAANQAGLGGLFKANDAIAAALESPGMVSLEETTKGFQQASQLLLRLRQQVNTGAYGLTQDELIDMSLGLRPTSGRSIAEIGEAVDRAVQSARRFLDAPGGQPFRSFGAGGNPQASSLGRARPS